MMEIREEISTILERQRWNEFFLTLSKEELAELLLEQMVRNRSFSRELFYKLSKDTSSVTELITRYETAVTGEMNLKVADVDYLRILSENAMRRATTEVNLLDKFKLYVAVIKNLDSTISYGAGWENEDEDVLLELMNECRDLMLSIVEERHSNLLTMEFGQVCDLLKNESVSYNPTDSDNRIEDVLSKISVNKVTVDCGTA